MARKKPTVTLTQPIRPQSGDLAQLFTSSEDTEQAAGLQLVAIRLDAIQPDPAQPRRTFMDDSLQELSESIRQDGVIQPIEVTQIRANVYMIVHGERRWRAAQLAGMETIPAVVRRHDYDEVTRFVRQLVENIQREDLNDVDRAAGLLRLRNLMQDGLEQASTELVMAELPRENAVSWAKVGQRLGYSRQRIHQLIKLLDLPDEIQQDVRDGRMSERDTRLYQGLKPSQQRALHEARLAGDIGAAEARQIADYLKENPDFTVYQTIRTLRQPPEPEPIANIWQEDEEQEEVGIGLTAVTPESALPDLSPTGARVTNTMRLSYVRQHLARIQRSGLSGKERQEILRLLELIQQDVQSLMTVLKTDA
jgi:ParB family chromosome partitioning protein